MHWFFVVYERKNEELATMLVQANDNWAAIEWAVFKADPNFKEIDQLFRRTYVRK